jgi:hypothetical protein
MYQDTDGFIWDRFVIRSFPLKHPQIDEKFDRNNFGVSRYPVGKKQLRIEWNIANSLKHTKYRHKMEKMTESARGTFKFDKNLEDIQEGDPAEIDYPPWRQRLKALWDRWVIRPIKKLMKSKKISSQPETEQPLLGGNPESAPESVFTRLYKKQSIYPENLHSMKQTDVRIHTAYRSISYPVEYEIIGDLIRIRFTPTVPTESVLLARLQLTGSKVSVEDLPISPPVPRWQKAKDKLLFRSTTPAIPSHTVIMQPAPRDMYVSGHANSEGIVKSIQMAIPWTLHRTHVNDIGDRGRWVSPSFHPFVRRCMPGDWCEVDLVNKKDEEGWRDWFSFFEQGLSVSQYEEMSQLGRIQARVVLEYKVDNS